MEPADSVPQLLSLLGWTGASQTLLSMRMTWDPVKMHILILLFCDWAEHLYSIKLPGDAGAVRGSKF